MGSAISTAAGATAAALQNGPLVTAVAVPLALGFAAGLRTLPPIFTWYQGLKKPKWTPPAPVIGQTWSVLYALMGYASYLVWNQTGWPSLPLGVYAAQLALNLAWQLIFFVAKRPIAAQADNLTLLMGVVATTVLFYQTDALAGKLMLPYLSFVVFANALNASLIAKNPKETRNRETHKDE